MAKTNKMVKQVPTGVKVIAVLDWIGAGFNIILGLITLVSAIAFMSMGKLAEGGIGFIMLIPTILMLGVGALMIFVGIGLWKARNWARITQIILSCLGVLYGVMAVVNALTMPVMPMYAGVSGALQIFGLILGLITIAIPAIIGSYLLFNKQAKQAFA